MDVTHRLVPQPFVGSPLDAFLDGAGTVQTERIRFAIRQEGIKDNYTSLFRFHNHSGFAILHTAGHGAIVPREGGFSSCLHVGKIPEYSRQTITFTISNQFQSSCVVFVEIRVKVIMVVIVPLSKESKEF